MKNIETELVGGEITGEWSYLKPITYVPAWRVVLEVIAFSAIVCIVTYGILFLVSIGVL